MTRRSEVLELAVLGLLHEGPTHGYALRKRVSLLLGPLSLLSYGTLYPCLRRLTVHGLIEQAPTDPGARSISRRPRLDYRLTPAGVARFRELLDVPDAAGFDDESFDVRFAFFSRTDAAIRLRVLEARRSRLQQRLTLARALSGRGREHDQPDVYLTELRRHTVESLERDLRWLDDLITTERTRAGALPG